MFGAVLFFFFKKTLKMKKIAILSALFLTVLFYSCKDDETTEPVKTLDKSQITNKFWVSTDNLGSFYLRSDFKSCGPDGKIVLGTWQWVNNSDTLQIDDSNLGQEKWVVKYCTATEMSAKMSKSTNYKIFNVK